MGTSLKYGFIPEILEWRVSTKIEMILGQEVFDLEPC